MAGCIRERFDEIMIEEAARDRFVQGTLEWLLLGKTDRVSSEFLNDVDEADVSAEIAEYYGLDPEQVQRAFEIGEQLVLDRQLDG